MKKFLEPSFYSRELQTILFLSWKEEGCKKGEEADYDLVEQRGKRKALVVCLCVEPKSQSVLASLWRLHANTCMFPS